MDFWSHWYHSKNIFGYWSGYPNSVGILGPNIAGVPTVELKININ